ncbi:MAG: hypothetical protein H6607_09645 [Flavobacteriales bacterium]|nr:hypothetical protein [Flavobacteriales bacterium]
MNSGLMLIEILFFYLWLDSDAGVYLKFLEKNKYKSFEILDSNNKPSKKFPMWIYLIINFLYIISIWNFGSDNGNDLRLIFSFNASFFFVPLASMKLIELKYGHQFSDKFIIAEKFCYIHLNRTKHKFIMVSINRDAKNYTATIENKKTGKKHICLLNQKEMERFMARIVECDITYSFPNQ